MKEAKDKSHKEIILTKKEKSYTDSVTNPVPNADLEVWYSLTDKEATQFASTMKKYGQLFDGAIENLKK